MKSLWIQRTKQSALSRIPNRQISVTDGAEAAETTADATVAEETLQAVAAPGVVVILQEEAVPEAAVVILQEKAAPEEDPTKKGAQTDVNA